MIDDQHTSDELDYMTATQELKKALYEICKTEFDRSSALDRLLKGYASLVVDIFSNNPFEVMSALEDFYDYNDYTDPETGEWHTFKEWSEYFADEVRNGLSQYIFEHLSMYKSLESICKSLNTEKSNWANAFSINSIEHLKDFMEYNDYEDDFLGVEQSLSDWKSFFDNDEFDLYNTSRELTKKNKELTKKIDEITKIVEK